MMQNHMYAGISFQNVRLTSADVFSDLESVPMHIRFESEDGSYGKVCFHLENVPLAEALVKAINETLAQFRAQAPLESVS